MTAMSQQNPMIDPSCLTRDARDRYDERVAICEHCGRMTVEDAERVAWAEVTGKVVEDEEHQQRS